jgi:hypothetical protein
MARLPSIYRILTLRTSLEEVMRLGDYTLVTEAWEEWRASDLLAWLKQHRPTVLSLLVALVPPDPNGDGAVFVVDEEGDPIAERPLYRLAQHRPTVAPR